MYKNVKDSNIFIIDSQGKRHGIKCPNYKAFSIIYNYDLFKKAINNIDIEKESNLIENLKKIGVEGIASIHKEISKNPPKQPRVITLGRAEDSGCIIINKPANKVFYYRKERDMFFNISFENLKTQLSKDSFRNLLLNNINKMEISCYPYSNKSTHLNLKNFNDLNEILETDLANEYIGANFYIPIDWNSLGYDYQTYEETDSNSLEQIAFDLVNSGIDLNEREQDIFCNKIISSKSKFCRRAMTEEEKRTYREQFYSKINSTQQYRQITESLVSSTDKDDFSQYVVTGKKRKPTL